uniref:Ig-like domain-containing protein n=1 Tax=Cyprinus carpio carpio TaxID=630221 RepID=A0A8C1DSH4_CYPCA
MYLNLKTEVFKINYRCTTTAKINDKRLTLVCVASGFYPDHVSVSWKVNGVERQDSVSTDTSAQQNKTTLMYHISSRIKVNDTDWMDPKSSFTCTVHFFNGEKYVNVTNTINGQKGLRKCTRCYNQPKGLKLLGFGYILFLSKSLLYALVVAGVVCKLKVIPDNYYLHLTYQICIYCTVYEYISIINIIDPVT